MNYPKDRQQIAGGKIVSTDELMAENRRTVKQEGIMALGAVPEQYLLPRTLQHTQRLFRCFDVIRVDKSYYAPRI